MKEMIVDRSAALAITASKEEDRASIRRILHCPICGTDFLHLGKPELCDGQDNYMASQWVRGDAIYIPFECEDGNHKGYFVLGFHKGVTLYWVEYLTTEYQDYLNTPEWKEMARQAKIKAGYRCQLCNREGNDATLHAHHRTYERIGNEELSDLTVLCGLCHSKFHNKP